MARQAIELLGRGIRRRAARILTGTILFLASAVPATAGTVGLTWDPVTAAGLSGYMVHYGTMPGTYPSKLDVGNVTTVTVPNLADTGTYYFVVTAYDASRTESAHSNSISKTPVPAAPVRTASLSANVVSGTAPLSTTFTSYYTGSITGYLWSFGDGTTSTASQPVKVYTTPGIYTVGLTVTGPGGSDTQTRANMITVSAAVAVAPAPAPTPVITQPEIKPPSTKPIRTPRTRLLRAGDLTASAISGVSPLPVDFNASYASAVSSYTWTFGDGTYSTDSNPTKVYTTPGVYPVSLIVAGPDGGDVQTKIGLITVLPAPPTSMQRIGMKVDVNSGPGTRSNLNGVLEPGETVLVEPSWRNDTSSPVTLHATASNVVGPPATAYALPNPVASFGAIEPGNAASCRAASGTCYRMAVSIPAARPSVHWNLHFAETLSNGDVLNSSMHIGHSFPDVPDSSAEYVPIETMLRNNVDLGREDGTFGPSAPASRLDTAVAVARGIVAPVGDGAIPVAGTVGSRPYSCTAQGASLIDNLAPTAAGCKQAHFLLTKGIAADVDCSSTGHCASSVATRGTLSALLASAVHAGGDAAIPPAATFSDSGTVRSYNCDAADGSHFPDVSANDRYCRHINYLWARGIVAAGTDGLFHPARALTRGEMARFIVDGMALTLY